MPWESRNAPVTPPVTATLETSSYDIAEKIRESLRVPGTEGILVQYLSGYLVDDSSDDEDILQVKCYIPESLALDKSDVLEKLMAPLTTAHSVTLTESAGTFSEGVDLGPINEGKCVYNICYLVARCLMYCARRASRVDAEKFEKQEAELKAKI